MSSNESDQQQPHHHNGSVSLPSLSYDILTLVMSYLPIKDLFSIAFLCKTFSRAVTIPMVVRSALFAGGHPMTSMKKLYTPMLARSIHPPSALRLLRLASGKRCEICLNKLQKVLVRHVRSTFGTFSCWHCNTKRQFSKAYKKLGAEYSNSQAIYDATFDYIRTAKKLYAWRTIGSGPEEEARERKRARQQRIVVRVIHVLDGNLNLVRKVQVRDLRNYLWKKPSIDRFGEKYGPVVCYTDIPRLVASVSSLSLNMTTLSSTHVNTARECFKLELDAPDVSDPKYTDFIETYKATIKSATAHQEDIKWKKTRATSDYKIRKLNNCKKLIEDLSGMIANPSIRNVLHYEINEWFLRTPIRYKYIPPILIRELWVRKLLLDILLVPSKVKKSTMERMAKVITKEYAVHQ